MAGCQVRGSARRSQQELAADAAAEVARLAEAAVGSLAAGVGLEAVELAIRTAVTRLGGGMLERLLAADRGYRGPGTDCEPGHLAEFVSYRDKTIDTVLGPVTIKPGLVSLRAVRARPGAPGRRAGHSRADDVTGTPQDVRPGRGGAVHPRRPGGRELAGITLTGKRLGRHAEADGRAAAAVIETEAAAIAARTLVPLPPARLLTRQAVYRHRRDRRAR